MDFLTATQSTWFLIGPIAHLLGFLMNGIFIALNAIGLPNIGLAIILFTLIVKGLMVPLSIKQQKNSSLQAIMQPELQAIQAKYKDKKDQASMMAQQEETRAVYNRFGTSPTGGCLQLIITMLIMFALYQVIYHMPGYIKLLGDSYRKVADVLMGIEGYSDNAELIKLATANTIRKAESIAIATDGAEQASKYVIDMLYNFSREEWTKFLAIFNNSQLESAYTEIRPFIEKANNFLGIDLTMTPMQQIWPGILIPILSGALQYLSTVLTKVGQPAGTKKNDSNAGMMNTMNIVFPLMSVVFCFMFQCGIGIYWVASSGVQVLIQLLVNNYMKKVDLNEMVAKNIEKLNKKRAKKGLPPQKVTKVTTVITNLEDQRKKEEENKQKIAEMAKNSTDYYARTTTAKKGSLAEKAGMVQQYDERVKELRSGRKK